MGRNREINTGSVKNWRNLIVDYCEYVSATSHKRESRYTEYVVLQEPKTIQPVITFGITA